MHEENDRPTFSATCAECGQEAKVPFEPSGDRPVYCKDCFAKRRSEQGDSRTLHSVDCSSCGQEAKVPFEPSGDRPVYCKECFAKNR